MLPWSAPKPRQLLSLPPFLATPCLLHVKKTAAYEWLPSARSLTTSLTSLAPSSSSRGTSTKDSLLQPKFGLWFGVCALCAM
ncbi:hypothetical protein MRB53_012029 [Persea americana]|uniref:Uncharacterized protein n=1 Tax=Persea americana TaxID=3435 RepID=A0ACC2LWG9_PERAE|nr:hypothetical protein MRB53_012029 [Persea americana]